MDITRRLRGKTIAAITTNGRMLRITCDDNSEIDVMWVDDNAKPVNGRPLIGNYGVRLHAEGIKDIMKPDLIRNYQ